MAPWGSRRMARARPSGSARSQAMRGADQAGAGDAPQIHIGKPQWRQREVPSLAGSCVLDRETLVAVA